MEHSYTRDWQQTPKTDIQATRTILMERAPLCSLCHTCTSNHIEKVDTPECHNVPLPPYNEKDGSRSLNATRNMIANCPNRVMDSDDWAAAINKTTWTEQQKVLFERAERILDMDQLARLAIAGLPNECLRRNAIIEKSMSRLRQALASVHWEPRVTQWFHALLMTHLPQTYMVSYIDMLRLLKNKIPTLVDKMLYDKPIDVHMDYVSAMLRPTWEPRMVQKTRALPGKSVILMVPSSVSNELSSREKQLREVFGTLATVESVKIDPQSFARGKTVMMITEHIVALSRGRIREIRIQRPGSNIVLVGFNVGAAIALQVASVEAVSSVVCLGFAFNTMNGVRGNIDDRILEITTPILFVIGQNAQRSSQEEIESMRENMSAQSSLVVVGSSDDALKVKRLNRVMQGITQSMIDNIIVDEVHEFAVSCILNPPAPRKPGYLTSYRRAIKRSNGELDGPINKRSRLGRTRTKNMAKVGANRTHRASETSSELDDVSLKASSESSFPTGDSLSNSESSDIAAHSEHFLMQNGRSCVQRTSVNETSPSIRQKVKLIPSNQFLHLKPPPVNIQKIYKTQDAGGSHSYTLGVNNIGTTDIGLGHTKLITVSNGHNPSQAPRKNIQIIKTPTKSPTIVHQTEEFADSAKIDSIIADRVDVPDFPSEFDEADIESMLANGLQAEEEVINGLDTDGFNSLDILSAKIVDDAIGQNGSDNDDSRVRRSPSRDSSDLIPMDGDSSVYENEHQPVNKTHENGQIELMDMANDNVEIVEETVDDTGTIPSPPKARTTPIQRHSHLNGGEFVLLNGSNQLKNIKCNKFVINEKPVILNGANGTNGTNGTNGPKHLVNGNGSKLRLVRPFARTIGAAKVSINTPAEEMDRRPMVKVLNGIGRIGGPPTGQNGFIIKRFGTNGTKVRPNITVRRVNLIRSNGMKLKDGFDGYDADETEIIDVTEAADDRQMSARDLIEQLES